ncbi:uncharacterized protein LOC115243058 [Formica exsecta]|uniref:uncharacterized protein LOC115243058 n=1 Tax=Formica exsecta TaxID=72781 RepID=UPI001142342D|nr:uncharacterized protein LOC115243058 [Formica exsecta]
MTFLNDILEYRQTVTSLQKSICEEQKASSSNCNSIPSTSTSNNFNVDDVLTSITNNNNSTSLSPVSPKSRKRKRIDLDEYEEAHEDEYNSILESSISTNVLPVENEYFKKRMRYIRKVLLLNKINEWKRTLLNWHKEMRRRQLVKTFLLHQFKKKKEKATM